MIFFDRVFIDYGDRFYEFFSKKFVTLDGTVQRPDAEIVRNKSIYYDSSSNSAQVSHSSSDDSTKMEMVEVQLSEDGSAGGHQLAVA